MRITAVEAHPVALTLEEPYTIAYETVERADNVARFLDVNFNINLGNGKSLQQQWSQHQ